MNSPSFTSQCFKYGSDPLGRPGHAEGLHCSSTPVWGWPCFPTTCVFYMEVPTKKGNSWGTLLWNLLWHDIQELSHIKQLQAITLFPTAWHTALCRWKSLHIFIYFIQPQSYSIANTLSRGKWRWQGAPSWLNMLKLLAENLRKILHQAILQHMKYRIHRVHLSWTGEEPMILISFCLFRSQNVAGTGKLYETLAKHTVWSKLVCVSLDHTLGIWQCLDICLNGFQVTTCLTSSPAWGDPNSYGTEAANFSILASRVIQTAPS